VYVRQRVADIRLGLLLALATAPGAVVGALLATYISPRILAAVFAAVLAISGYRMYAGGRGSTAALGPAPAGPEAMHASRFRGHYLETSTGEIIEYRVQRVPLGVVSSTAAGLVSGLLGVGGGIVQVPVMNLLMSVPIKVATTTSTYIIGITAMASAFVYYNHQPSYVDPAIAVPVTIGVFIGASIGPGILRRASPSGLRTTFALVVALYTVQMALRVFGIGSG
jgi:uncharacterized membrane protein YfcA